MQLGRVLGLTTRHNAALAIHPKTGEIAYIAGSVVILYSARKNRQQKYLVADAPLVCVAFSSEGSYVAAGERREAGVANVLVWSCASAQLMATLSAHRHGVGVVAFSPHSSRLVSCGFRDDAKLVVWDVSALNHGGAPTMVANADLGLGAKVFGASYTSADDVVTAGDKGVVFFSLEELTLSARSTTDAALKTVVGVVASRLAGLERRTFRDVAVLNERAYAVTDRGELAVFSVAQKVLERFMSLESPGAFGLSILGGRIAVGCAEGVTRLFEERDLTYADSLPRPLALGKNLNATSQPTTAEVNSKETSSCDLYPATVAVRFAREGSAVRVVCVYADRSLFVWELMDEPKGAIGKYRSFLHHSARIWDLHCLSTRPPKAPNSPNGAALENNEQLPFPEGTVVTCSADGTVRCFEPEAAATTGRGLTKLRQRARRNIYSREMLQAATVPGFDNEAHTLSTSRDMPDLERGGGAFCGGAVEDAALDDKDPPLLLKGSAGRAPRTLCVRPGLGEIAVGNRMGHVLIYEASTLETSHQIAAHVPSEVLSLKYSATGLLASAGADGIVHLFDAAKGYALLQTLEHHQGSPVTALRFSRANGFFSCGGDATLAFCTVVTNPDKKQHIRRHRTVRVQGDTKALRAMDATLKHLCTAGTRLDLWSLTGKRCRSYAVATKEAPELEILRISINEAATYIAACCSDRSVRLYDYFTGSVLCSASGHGDSVSSISFSADGSKLLTAGGDSCLMTWNIAPELVKVANERLAEMDASARAASAITQHQHQHKPAPVEKQHDSQAAEHRARVLEGVFADGEAAPAWSATRPAPTADKKPVINPKPAPPYPAARGKWAESATAAAPATANDDFYSGDKAEETLMVDFLEDGDDVIVCDVEEDEEEEEDVLDAHAADDSLSLSASFRGLKLEKAALKARQKGKQTNAALENMRARLTAMGILKEGEAAALVAAEAAAAMEVAPVVEEQEELPKPPPKVEDTPVTPPTPPKAAPPPAAPPAVSTPRRPPLPELLQPEDKPPPLAGASTPYTRPTALATVDGPGPRTQEDYESALGELQVAAQRAFDLYAELQTIPAASPILQATVFKPPPTPVEMMTPSSTAGDVLSNFRRSFANLNDSLHRAATPNDDAQLGTMAAARRANALNASAFPSSSVPVWMPMPPSTAGSSRPTTSSILPNTPRGNPASSHDLAVDVAPVLERYSDLLCDLVLRRLSAREDGNGTLLPKNNHPPN